MAMVDQHTNLLSLECGTVSAELGLALAPSVPWVRCWGCIFVARLLQFSTRVFWTCAFPAFSIYLSPAGAGVGTAGLQAALFLFGAYLALVCTMLTVLLSPGSFLAKLNFVVCQGATNTPSVDWFFHPEFAVYRALSKLVAVMFRSLLISNGNSAATDSGAIRAPGGSDFLYHQRCSTCAMLVSLWRFVNPVFYLGCELEHYWLSTPSSVTGTKDSTMAPCYCFCLVHSTGFFIAVAATARHDAEPLATYLYSALTFYI